MKNAKEYKRRLENHDDARYTFEHWNGMSIYPSYNMTPEDIKELRAEYKKDKAQNVATQLDTRAIEIEYMDNVYILKSYYTNVACIYNNKLYKLWNGYSNIWNNTFYKIIDPYITILNSLPKVALGPLIIIWIMLFIKL